MNYLSDSSLQRLTAVHMIICRVDRLRHCTSTSTPNSVVPFHVTSRAFRIVHTEIETRHHYAMSCFLRFFIDSTRNDFLCAISHIYEDLPCFINELCLCSFHLWKIKLIHEIINVDSSSLLILGSFRLICHNQQTWCSEPTTMVCHTLRASQNCVQFIRCSQRTIRLWVLLFCRSWNWFQFAVTRLAVTCSRHSEKSVLREVNVPDFSMFFVLGI